MKKTIFIILSLILFSGACTKNFEEANTNPYQISDESLKQDFNFIGAYFPTMLFNLFGDQIEEDLIHDSYVRISGCPTPFVGNVNCTTYYMTWGGANAFWNRIYNNVMAPARQVIKLAEEGGYEVFAAWAKLIRLIGASKLTSYVGPIIYSDYGSTAETVNYDSEQQLYNEWFTELDEILTVFKANTDYQGSKRFDASYSGDINKWIKVVNSMRLRLAIRISKADPALAKTQGEKAIADAGGLILANYLSHRIKWIREDRVLKIKDLSLKL